MTGSSDPLYILARRVLLDTLDALWEHRDALILVGAQAIYLHTGDADLAVAPFTSDVDFAINPDELKPDPRLADALTQAGFFTNPQTIGIWTSSIANMTTDLLVPETLVQGGRRSADLGSHGSKVARKVKGLEATLVDTTRLVIGALDPEDLRRRELRVAGPAALLLAKLHKLGERKDTPSRLKDKDALDIYRLLQTTSTADLTTTLRQLCTDPRSAQSAQEGIAYLHELFATPDALGSRMAGQAVELIGDPLVLAQSVTFLAEDLLQELRRDA